MPILSSIVTPFGSSLSLSELFEIEDTKRERIEANSSKNCHDTIGTVSCSEWSYGSLEAETLSPRSILKKTNSSESMESNSDERLKSWIEQRPISYCVESTTDCTRPRRSISSQSSPNKYDRVKTRFPGREKRRNRQEPRVREPRTEKSVKEQWVKTCRFLW